MRPNIDKVPISSIGSMYGNLRYDMPYSPSQNPNFSYNLYKQTGGLMRFASGGYLPYGNRLNDTIPALLSGGEYIVNSRAVRRYGVGGMNRINAGIARFEDGGLVGTTTGTQTPGNVESSSSNNVSINITVNATAGETASEEQTSTNNQNDQNANLGRRIKQAVLQVIVEEQRSGGLLDSTKKR